jgi:very-short-patch-repair endonuclease
MKTSKLEELLAFQLCAVGLNGFRREYKFCPDRKWRSDFAFPYKMILIECEGSVWANGRHNRGSGFVKDMEKYNTAALLGYRLLRFDYNAIKSGEAIKFIQEILK